MKVARATTGWCAVSPGLRGVRTAGAVAVASVVVASIVVMIPPTLAVVTSSVTAGVLTVTSDDQGDEIVVRCSAGGFVRVNGARPDTGPVACADITAILVAGTGGADDIRLQQVNDVIFAGLASVTIDGGEGNDVVRASEIADSITTGGGDDDVLASPADGDSIDGGEGRDVLSTEIASDVGDLGRRFHLRGGRDRRDVDRGTRGAGRRVPDFGLAA